MRWQRVNQKTGTKNFFLFSFLKRNGYVPSKLLAKKNAGTSLQLRETTTVTRIQRIELNDIHEMHWIMKNSVIFGKH